MPILTIELSRFQNYSGKGKKHFWKLWEDFCLFCINLGFCEGDNRLRILGSLPCPASARLFKRLGTQRFVVLLPSSTQRFSVLFLRLCVSQFSYTFQDSARFSFIPQYYFSAQTSLCLFSDLADIVTWLSILKSVLGLGYVSIWVS